MDLVFSVVVGFADQVNLPKDKPLHRVVFHVSAEGLNNRQTSCKTIGLEKSCRLLLGRLKLRRTLVVFIGVYSSSCRYLM